MILSAPRPLPSDWSAAMVLLVMVCCAVAGEGPHATSVAITIRTQTILSDARATLADVADLEGDIEVVARLRGLPVANLPDLTPVTISAKLITALATRAASPAKLRIIGAGTVARRARVWSVDEMAATAAATLSADAVWKTVRVSGAITAPDSPTLRLVAEMIDASSIGDTPFRIRAMDGEQEAARALVVLHVERHGEVLVAARDLRRGEIAAPGDLRRERRQLDRSNRAALNLDPETLFGRMVRRDVAAGSVVPADLMVLPPSVRSGATVTGTWTGENFAIDMSVTALADARSGERLTVRRISDGSILHAIAHSNGSVVIVR